MLRTLSLINVLWLKHDEVSAKMAQITWYWHGVNLDLTCIVMFWGVSLLFKKRFWWPSILISHYAKLYAGNMRACACRYLKGGLTILFKDVMLWYFRHFWNIGWSMCIVGYILSNVCTEILDIYCSNGWVHLSTHLLAADELLAQEYISISGLTVHVNILLELLST